MLFRVRAEDEEILRAKGFLLLQANEQLFVKGVFATESDRERFEEKLAETLGYYPEKKKPHRRGLNRKEVGIYARRIK